MRSSKIIQDLIFLVRTMDSTGTYIFKDSILCFLGPYTLTPQLAQTVTYGALVRILFLAVYTVPQQGRPESVRGQLEQTFGLRKSFKK